MKYSLSGLGFGNAVRARSASRFASVRLLLLIGCTFLLSACEGDSSVVPEGFVPNTSPDNQAPVANAGPDLNGVVGTLVTLDGTGSSDADGDVLLAQWVLDSAPTNSQAEINDPNRLSASITPDVAGTYVLALGVTDGGLAAQDALTLTVAAAGLPIANAGRDQTVTASTLVRLDGSLSSSPDNAQLSYAWTIADSPAGSSATLSDASAVNPTFTPDLAGTWQIGLVVNDGNSSSNADTVLVIAGIGNQPPVANAGPDQTTMAGSVVALDGTASTDPNSDALTYRWSLNTRPSGSSASLSDSRSATPEFVADVAGNYEVGLVVNDGAADSSVDVLAVIASAVPAAASPNSPPVANAGSDQSVATGTLIQMDGSASFDAEGSALTYRWQFVSRPSGSSAVLGRASAPNPQFTADVDGTYVLELVVSDGDNDSSADRVLVTSASTNGAPMANAGPDQNVSTGTRVQLDGTRSSDANGDALTYAWLISSKPSGSSAVLNQATIAAPHFTADLDGSYVLRLTVNDGSSTSVEDTVTVTASSANSAPVANAGPNLSVAVGAAARFDGRGSSDADGDALTYQWTLSSRPSGSSASLSSTSAPQPTLVADRAGTYVAGLTVSDGQRSSASDSATLTAATGNRAPVADAGANQTIATGTRTDLDGRGSADPDGDLLSYSWTLQSRPGGSSAAISNASSDVARLTTDRDGTYIARLIVSDGQSSSAADTVNIISTAGNAAPSANAGNDQSVVTGAQVQLSASGSSDPDGDSLSYAWSVTSRPAGSSASLNSTTSASPRFSADVDGSYNVRLVVNDGELSSQPDTVRITATSSNNLPVANAGPNQSVTTGQLVQLNGNSSSDADGDSLSYVWSIVTRPSGSSAALTSTSAASTSFTADRNGNYAVRLVVNDGTGNSAPDSVTISAASANQAPTAVAGANQSVTVGDQVTLNGAGSSDPDGDALTYSWTLTTRPGGSSAALSNASSSSPRFTADVAGSYRARLIVNDGTVASAASTIDITATSSGGNSSGGVSDDFSGNGPLLGYTTNNASALPDVARVGGRYRANLTNNTNDVTLHFNNDQGRLDAKLVSFPFEYIAYNIGIGTQSNSQSAPNPGGSPFMFAGVQVHVTNLNSRNSAHVVVGHRGSTRFTIEGKNTVNGRSSVNDDGANVLPSGRADIRIVGDASRNLTVYWRQPNSNGSWRPYRGNGRLPGTQASFGSQVYVGLITYAFRASSVPFVGTADGVELVGE